MSAAQVFPPLPPVKRCVHVIGLHLLLAAQYLTLNELGLYLLPVWTSLPPCTPCERMGGLSLGWVAWDFHAGGFTHQSPACVQPVPPRAMFTWGQLDTCWACSSLPESGKGMSEREKVLTTYNSQGFASAPWHNAEAAIYPCSIGACADPPQP